MRKGGRLLSFTVPAAWLKAWVGAGSVGGGVVVEGAAVDGCGVVGSIVVAGGVAVSSIPASAKPPLRRWPRRVRRARLFSHPRPSYAAAYARARRIEHGKQPHGDTLGSFARVAEGSLGQDFGENIVQQFHAARQYRIGPLVVLQYRASSLKAKARLQSASGARLASAHP